MNIFKVKLLSFLLLILTSFNSTSEIIENLSNEDIEFIINSKIIKASNGDPIEQFNLGNLYIDGRYVKQDTLKALEYFEKSSEQGYKPSKLAIANIYYNGDLVSTDHKKAMKLFKELDKKSTKYNIRIGAKTGIAFILYDKYENLSKIMNNKTADNKIRNYEQTAFSQLHKKYKKDIESYIEYKNFIKLNSDEGHNKFQIILANIYKDNLTKIKKEIPQAHLLPLDKKAMESIKKDINSIHWEWYDNYTLYKNQKDKYIRLLKIASASSNNGIASLELAKFYLYNNNNKNNEGLIYLNESANKGNLEAIRLIGEMYHFGYYERERNQEYAIKHFKMAAERGDIISQLFLGDIFYNENNYKESFKYFEMAAISGNYMGQFDLAKFYKRGYGVKEDMYESFKWLKKSAEQGYSLAQLYLGDMYKSGKGTTQSDENALIWYERAAKSNNPVAQLHMGNAHLKGTENIDINYNKAAKFLLSSSKMGNKKSMYSLGKMYYKEQVKSIKNYEISYILFTLSLNVKGALSLQKAVTDYFNLIDGGDHIIESLKEKIEDINKCISNSIKFHKPNYCYEKIDTIITELNKKSSF